MSVRTPYGEIVHELTSPKLSLAERVKQWMGFVPSRQCGDADRGAAPDQDLKRTAR